MTEQK